MADQTKIQVKVDPSDEAGHYSNAVSVHVNGSEMSLDFGFLLPASDPATVKLVSRINVSKQTARSLADALNQALAESDKTTE